MATTAQDDALLDRIRERYQLAEDGWRDIHTEGAEDMRYVAGDPWSAEDKAQRKEANRPALALDFHPPVAHPGVGDRARLHSDVVS